MKGQATSYVSTNRHNGKPFDPTKTQNLDFEIYYRPSQVAISLLGVKIVNPMYKLLFLSDDHQTPARFCIFYGLEEIPEGYNDDGGDKPYRHTLTTIGIKRDVS